MEFSEATKIVFGRIQTVEPDLVSKIIGYLLLKNNGDQEMIRLAFGPDNSIHSIISEAKSALSALALPPRAVSPLTPTEFSLFSRGVDFNQPGRLLGEEGIRPAPSLPQLPAKICHYYFKGYCKHGRNCRYYHGLNGLTRADFIEEEIFLSPESLATLECELKELILSRGGQPISISLLPMLYFERYGKFLQADGYLTESQRNGMAGFGLTKLLARLGNSFRVLEGPHGQHSIVLSEDARKQLEYIAGSHQIYLTFPAESEFSEEDVSNYFKRFGPVRDVRIPSQRRRMFGFVSFENQETVQFVLAQGNPHFISGARVLVKPYKEKPRVADRRSTDEVGLSPHHYSQFVEMDPNVNSIPNFCYGARLPKKNSPDDHERVGDLQTLLRLSELQLSDPRSIENMPLSRHGMYDQLISGDFASVNGLNSVAHLDGVGFSLPDSPFASAPMANGRPMTAERSGSRMESNQMSQ